MDEEHVFSKARELAADTDWSESQLLYMLQLGSLGAVKNVLGADPNQTPDKTELDVWNAMVSIKFSELLIKTRVAELEFIRDFLGSVIDKVIEARERGLVRPKD